MTAKGFVCWLSVIVLTLGLAGCGKKKYAPPPPTGPDRTGRAPATQRPYTVNGRTYYPIPSAQGHSEKGIASWYGRKFHGRKTANGETYDMYALTAAHKTLPMNTLVNVVNLNNGDSVKVRINDRGPFVRGRIIDLSYSGAKAIGLIRTGTAPVRIEAVGQPGRDGQAPPGFTLGRLTIQVGAFTDRDNALRLQKKLNAAYSDAQAAIVRYDRGDRIFFRVRVFSVDKPARAEQKQDQLQADGFGRGFVVALD